MTATNGIMSAEDLMVAQSQRLAEETDELNADFEVVAQRLEALALGVPGSVQFRESGSWLRWTKRGTQWQLIVIRVDGAEVELRHLSRADRMHAAHLLPALYADMKQASLREAAAVADARQAIHKFLASLPGEPPARRRIVEPKEKR